MFTPWCQGPELSDAIFTLLQHVKNVSASERHRPCFPKVGHTYHWLLDRIQRSTKQIFGQPYYSWWRHSLEYTYITAETFGIVPFGGKVDESFNEDDFDNLSSSLQYVCRKMKSSAPHLLILTQQEKRLFGDCINDYIVTKNRKVTSVDFARMASDCNNGILKYMLQPTLPPLLLLQP
jgi:hypothetical protein